MLIILTGPRSAGKSTLKQYLLSHKGFKSVHLAHRASASQRRTDDKNEALDTLPDLGKVDLHHHDNKHSYYDIVGVTNSAADSFEAREATTPADILSSPTELLSHITHNWRHNLVTVDIDNKATLEPFLKRPFVLLVSVDAPVLVRYRRYQRQSGHPMSLEDFVEDNDRYVYGTGNITSGTLHGLSPLAHLHVLNSFGSISELHVHLESLDLLNPDRLRPGWDTYFMTLASLASLRSNCMKRRVGAILVRDHRIVATGYNGTPRSVKNCNEGGCARCNDSASSPSTRSHECLCLHAEENALLEAGRERVGDRAVLYCNTCPCLKCTIKIVQTGVKEVVYNLSYKMDSASAQVFLDAGVKFRQYSPPK